MAVIVSLFSINSLPMTLFSLESLIWTILLLLREFLDAFNTCSGFLLIFTKPCCLVSMLTLILFCKPLIFAAAKWDLFLPDIWISLLEQNVEEVASGNLFCKTGSSGSHKILYKQPSSLFFISL